MTIEQGLIIILGMTASLYIGFQIGWSSAFKKIDKIMEDFEKSNT
jgi:hypothetical protein